MELRVLPDEEFLRALEEDFGSAMATRPESVTREDHVHVADMGGFELAADVYYKDRRPDEPRPALVYMHDWAGGKQPRLCAERQSAYFALRANFLCVPLYYRQPAEGRFPAALQDLKCCIRWVRSIAEDYAIDPDKVIVMGSSAGTQWAGLAAATNGVADYEGAGGFSEYSSDVNLAVLKSAIYDAFDFGPGRLMEQIMGGTADDAPDRYREGSLVHRIHHGMPPVLMIHGDEDASCPLKSAVAAYEKMQAAGVPSELRILEGRGHGLLKEDLISHLDEVIDFVREQLAWPR